MTPTSKSKIGTEPRPTPPPWWRRRPVIEPAWPPGVTEMDLWRIDATSMTLFDPDRHEGPRSLVEVPDLFAPLDTASESEPKVRSVPGPHRRDYPVEDADGSIDRLAWYRTFRARGAWGIYLREQGVESVASELTAAAVGPAERQIAATVLYLHEYAHFLFDVAAAALEGVVAADLYEAHRREIVRQAPGWHPVEEAVCNAFAYAHVRAPGRKRQLRRFLLRGPTGYQDFAHYLDRSSFRDGVEAVLGEVLHGTGGRPGTGLRGLFRDGPDPSVGAWMVPVHLVAEPECAPIYALITALGALDATSKFTRELARLPAEVQQRWRHDVLPSLHVDVRQASGFKRLEGHHDLFSVRVAGQYRAIIRRQGGDRWSAEHIGHRSTVYRGL